MSLIDKIFQNIKRFSERQSVYAIHDDDLLQMLNELNLTQELSEGKIKCSNCGATITIDNISSILKNNEKILFNCDSLDCIQKKVS